ncbi:hypothetical protein EVAR_29075_1 [Eumeta japonica]|uniref:Uncharacterized protein n=1 Tax=Eumeta variegata TaxID=151549 RepID=A0A4C1VQ00_EUMVA|nr:hypothetical protein EVAR_29075_1 [Eumeta japonica]
MGKERCPSSIVKSQFGCEVAASTVVLRQVSEISGGTSPFLNFRPSPSGHSCVSIRYPIHFQDAGNALIVYSVVTQLKRKPRMRPPLAVVRDLMVNVRRPPKQTLSTHF